MSRYAYFGTLSTKTLNAMLAGWEREYDRTYAGDVGTLPESYLEGRMDTIRIILNARSEEQTIKKRSKGNDFK